MRIEDVAIGFAISLGVGLLFWPRGAADLAAGGSRRRVRADRRLRRRDGPAADRRRLRRRRPSRRAPRTSPLHRLDDAFRQYLAERSATAVNVERGRGARRRRGARPPGGAVARGARPDDRRQHVARPLRARTSTSSYTRCTPGTSRSDTRSSIDARSPRRTSAMPTAAAACSPACAIVAAAGQRRSTPRSSWSGRPSTSTISGASSPTWRSRQRHTDSCNRSRMTRHPSRPRTYPPVRRGAARRTRLRLAHGAARGWSRAGGGSGRPPRARRAPLRLRRPVPGCRAGAAAPARRSRRRRHPSRRASARPFRGQVSGRAPPQG